jgi:regulator of protease activity HflC (stomatin/prohibitin superfamily)
MKQFRFQFWHLILIFFLVSALGWRVIPLLVIIIILANVIFPLLREQFDVEKLKKSKEKEEKSIYDLPTDAEEKKKAFSSIKYPKINFNLPNMKSLFGFRNISILIGILIVFVIILDGLVSVPAGHAAVIYDRGRGVLADALPEGLHLKIPFWQVSTIMDTRLRVSTMSIAPAEGNIYGDDSIEALTRDGQKVSVDITVQYHITAKNAPRIFQTKGDDSEYPAKIIRPGARSVIRDVITGYDSTKLFTLETRLEATKAMEDQLKALYETNLITLDKLLLRNIQFSEQYLSSIEEKQIAQQRIQKAEYQRQEAEKLKEKKIIEAEAESEAVRLKGVMLQKYPNVIQFEFVQRMADDIQWGFLPSNSVPLLDLKNLGLK